jgi:hypothetical protein
LAVLTVLGGSLAVTSTARLIRRLPYLTRIQRLTLSTRLAECYKRPRELLDTPQGFFEPVDGRDEAYHEQPDFALRWRGKRGGHLLVGAMPPLVSETFEISSPPVGDASGPSLLVIISRSRDVRTPGGH